MAENEALFKSYEDFWPHYLHSHSKRETRLLHMVGLFMGVASIVKGVVALKLGWILLAPVIAYGFSWAAHAFIEHNIPATFEHPTWSIRADFQMAKMWLMGELPEELARYEIRT